MKASSVAPSVSIAVSTMTGIFLGAIVGLDHAAGVEAVQFGHHKVHDHQVRLFRPRLIDAFFAVARSDDVEAFQLKTRFQSFRELGFVFHHQNFFLFVKAEETHWLASVGISNMKIQAPGSLSAHIRPLCQCDDFTANGEPKSDSFCRPIFRVAVFRLNERIEYFFQILAD